MSIRFIAPAAAAALSLALLTACGGTTDAEPAASPTPEGQGRPHQIETITADCMKQKGFTYIPYLPPPADTSEEYRKRNSGDYAAMKKHRQKYGYDVWSAVVYPEDQANPPVDPNIAVRAALSDAQRQAYATAYNTCGLQAIKQVTGKELSTVTDRFQQLSAMIEQRKTRELDGDPQLVELAAAMGSCLKTKGYQVGSTKPSALGDRGITRFRNEHTQVTLEQAESRDQPKKTTSPVTSTMTPDEARPYLEREIKDALDDLECGRDFYPIYAPKAAEIERQAQYEYGLEG